MKKLIFSLLLMACMATASAQFAVSAHLGGAFSTSASTYTGTYFGVSPVTATDTTYAVDIDPYNGDRPLDLTGGLKIGYQFGRIQVGLSGSFSWSHVKGDFSPAQYNQHNYNLSPDDKIPLTWKLDDYTGYYTAYQTSFRIAPYIRYEVIQLGDVAFFLELDAFYTKVNTPHRFEFVDFYHMEMHHTHEHDSIVQKESNAWGVQLTPGLSWQLTEHCNIDLYFDLMAVAFTHSVYHESYKQIVWDDLADPIVISQTITTDNTTTSNTIGYEATGIPSLAGTSRNWVRVGFNYTF